MFSSADTNLITVKIQPQPATQAVGKYEIQYRKLGSTAWGESDRIIHTVPTESSDPTKDLSIRPVGNKIIKKII